MFNVLIEASKLQIVKGVYQLSFDENAKVVNVIDRRSGALKYTVSGENDNMLMATIIYFGLKAKAFDKVSI